MVVLTIQACHNVQHPSFFREVKQTVCSWPYFNFDDQLSVERRLIFIEGNLYIAFVYT